MKVEILPSVAKGSITPPSSKSIAHRALILAAFANGTSTIHHVPLCNDLKATMKCLQTLGICIKQDNDTLTVRGTDAASLIAPKEALHCDESGSTLRFLIPLLSLCQGSVSFTGQKRLFERPLGVYQDMFCSQGKTFLVSECGLLLQGPLKAGKYVLPQKVSSQFATGLLLALPLFPGDSELLLTSPVESRPYIDLTLQVMERFGLKVESIGENRWKIPGGQQPYAVDISMEADESAASFFGALNFLGGDVQIKGRNPQTLQGDRVWQTLLNRLKQPEEAISLADCPDLAPILFAMAAEKGATFTNVSRLREKESDRIVSMVEELSKCGAKAVVGENSVCFLPAVLRSSREPLQSHNDHRVAMALGVLLTRLGGSIEGAEAVEKSYPAFWRDLQSLQIRLNVK